MLVEYFVVLGGIAALSFIIRIMAYFIEGGIKEKTFYKIPVDYFLLFIASCFLFCISLFNSPLFLPFIPIYYFIGYIVMLKYYVYLKKDEYNYYYECFHWVTNCKFYIIAFCEFYWPVILFGFICNKIYYSNKIKEFIKTPEKEWNKVKNKLDKDN